VDENSGIFLPGEAIGLLRGRCQLVWRGEQSFRGRHRDDMDDVTVGDMGCIDDLRSTPVIKVDHMTSYSKERTLPPHATAIA